MPIRVRIARGLLLTTIALYVAYSLGAPDPFGVSIFDSLLAGLDPR